MSLDIRVHIIHHFIVVNCKTVSIQNAYSASFILKTADLVVNKHVPGLLNIFLHELHMLLKCYAKHVVINLLNCGLLWIHLRLLPIGKIQVYERLYYVVISSLSPRFIIKSN